MNHNKPCKESYIGAPVRAYANVCQYCHGHGCGHCGGHRVEMCGCGKPKGMCGCAKKQGICEAVVDDNAGVVYLYGNVKHEDYHVPSQNCIAFTGVVSAGFPYTGTIKADEIFEGEQDNNNIVVAHTPIPESDAVYLNGLKQIEGAERDYRKTADNTYHFNFYNLLPTDVVEVVYRYVAGQED